MTTLDLHPEDLLDKDAAGTLSSAEMVRLQGHLVQCATCRFEREARADFRVEMAKSDELAAMPSLAGFVERAAAAAAHKERPIATAPRGRPRIWAAALLPAAVLLLASAAAASLSQEVRTAVVELLAPTPKHAIEKGTTRDAPGGVANAKAAPAAPPAEAPVEALAPMPPPAEAPVAGLRPRVAGPRVALPSPRRSAAPPPETLLAPVPVDLPSPQPSALAAVEAPAAPDASALFAAASQARSRGERTRAVTLHRELQRAHPTSREAQVSRATLGRLLLDAGDATGALASFDTYLAQRGGALEEEAMIGRALALGRLGRPQDEASAWSTVLAAHPGSTHAPRARARLEELGRR